MSSREIQEKMLEELQRIREAVEAKPSPPPPPPKGFWDEFMEFLNKYGVIGLAVAFIIGGAAGRLVSAIVGDMIMPILTFLIPGGGWEQAVLDLGPVQLAVGHLAGAVIDFLVIALVVFVLMRQLAKTGIK